MARSWPRASSAKLLSDYGIEPDDRVGAYCGSGVTATITLAALTTMGYAPALFPGVVVGMEFGSVRAVARGSE